MVVRAAEFGYVQRVSEFTDITGAAGTKYRFRRIDRPARLPATAGNFIFMRARPAGNEKICCVVVTGDGEGRRTYRPRGADLLEVRLETLRRAR